jgi:23S rRNA (uridine2552-2'-O)-methyltransferase
VTRRSRSSERWLREHFSDPFVQRAKSEGWRSRAVYKLQEIDRKEKLLQPGMTVLDLGAAPGAWTQYVRRQVGRQGVVIASDILEMEPIAGVDFVQGDFRDEAVAAALRARCPDGRVDVLLSDMAPNLSGMDAIDQPRSLYLAELALDLAGGILKPGGSALIKTFQGSGFQEFVTQCRERFAKVRFAKPDASRARSPELYVVARSLN